MSDIANDLIADYEREAKPEGADAYRDTDVRIRAAHAIRSLRREVREQRREIAGLREERRAVLEADRPQVDRRLAALEQLAALDEELGLPRTPNPHATPAECRLLPGCTETSGK